MSKIVHYRSKCIGCGICQEQQPAYWRMSKKDGKATLLHGQVKKEVSIQLLHSDDIPTALNLVEACPARVIKVV